jgi:site-specific recombinase XerC
MLAVIGTPDDSWLSQRGHILFLLMYNTGARVSEIIGIKISDVVLDDHAACVHLCGKGRKQRSVPLWRSTVKALRAWLRVNPEVQPTSLLLPNRNDHVMTRTNVTLRLALAINYGDASIAGWRRHQRHRAVARSRESDHYTSLRRGRSNYEGARIG